MAHYEAYRDCQIETETLQSADDSFTTTWRTYAERARPRAGAMPMDSGRCGPYSTQAEAEQQARARAKESIDRMLALGGGRGGS
jgi:hypothetical protein